MKTEATGRRRFIRLLATGVTALPAGAALTRVQPLHARETPKLPEDDPAAFALGYVHDASDVDVSKYPRYEPGQICANCQQWRAGPDVEWGPCAIFPGKLVRNGGWCSVWVRKVS